MSMLACSTNHTVRSQASDDIRIIEESVERNTYTIPESLLIKCRWMIPYREGDLIQFAQDHNENAERFRECFILHNSLIDAISGNSDLE